MNRPPKSKLPSAADSRFSESTTEAFAAQKTTMQPSSCLIAGCGYVGLRIARRWQSTGSNVIAITRSEARAEILAEDGLTPLKLDLASPPPELPIPAADTIFWAVGFDRSANIPREQVWIDGLRWFVRNLSTPPRRFIYVSSTSVYGTGNGEDVDEATATNPVTEGGQCCVEAEQLLREECANRFPECQIVVLRMAGIYGPNRLLRRIADLQNQQPLPGDPEHWLNLIHVNDAVRLIAHVASATSVPDIINVVNAGTLDRGEYYSHLANLVSAPEPIFSKAAASGRSRGGNRRVTSSYRSLAAEVGFEFDDIRAGIEQSVEATDGC